MKDIGKCIDSDYLLLLFDATRREQSRQRSLETVCLTCHAFQWGMKSNIGHMVVEIDRVDPLSVDAIISLLRFSRSKSFSGH